MKSVDKKNYQQAIDTIFVTDNDPYHRISFSSCLKEINRHYTVESIKCSSDLFSLLNYVRPDILFLSMELFSQSCVECLISIRRNPAWSDIPVIVYSNSARASNIATAYELGADLFFMKPTTNDEMVELLKMVLALDWSSPHIVKESFKENGIYTALH